MLAPVTKKTVARRRPALTADQCAAAVRSCLCFNLRALTRDVKAVYDGALRPAGLNSGQFALLLALQISGPTSKRDLAATIRSDRTTLSRNLRPLIQRRLVAEARGDDLRTRRVELTSLGIKTIAACVPAWKNAQRQAARLLTDDGMNRLLAVVHDSLDTIRRREKG